METHEGILLGVREVSEVCGVGGGVFAVEGVVFLPP
jgi:hypothetical protein